MDTAAAGSSLAGDYLAKSPVAIQDNDFLGSMDWDQGNVSEGAKNVVEGLLRKEVWVNSPVTKQARAKRSLDPRIAMDMRHKKVLQHYPLLYCCTSIIMCYGKTQVQKDSSSEHVSEGKVLNHRYTNSVYIKGYMLDTVHWVLEGYKSLHPSFYLHV